MLWWFEKQKLIKKNVTERHLNKISYFGIEL